MIRILIGFAVGWLAHKFLSETSLTTDFSRRLQSTFESPEENYDEVNFDRWYGP